MASSTLALKEALKAELPSIEFEEIELEYFIEKLEEGGSDDAVAESWRDMLMCKNAASDDESSNELCAAILKRLRAPRKVPQAQEDTAPVVDRVDGLGEWLSELRLEPYKDKVEAWCSSQEVKDLNGVLRNHESLIQSVEFKRCEVNRIVRNAQTPGAQNGAPIVADKLRQQKEKLLSGCRSFGNPGKSPYAIKEKIGKGASGEVFRCLRYEDNSGELIEYAVKMIGLRHLKMHQNYNQNMEKLKSEISILFSLQHPNIVSIYDVVDDGKEEKMYLVMELVRGGDLFDYIKSSTFLKEDLAADICLQLVDALQYIHEKKIVHRDLKPENLLVDKSSPDRPIVKISDFGASKFSNDGYSVSQTRVGTEQYWAPEVQDARRTKQAHDERADLWSLGVILYVMLTGGYPFYDDEDERMTKKIQQGKFEFDSDSPVSQEARDLIKNLIRPKPADRLSLTQCLNHSWVKRFARTCTTSGRETDIFEESIALPADVKEVKRFREDLNNFTIGFKFGTTLRGKREVVVRWSLEGSAPSDEVLKSARLELQTILRKHFEGFNLPPRKQVRHNSSMRGSGYPTLPQNSTVRNSEVGKSLAPVMEKK